jgi:hypothetical protein
MEKKSQWVQITLFLTFIALFFVLNAALPDKEFSDRENRYLQQSPAFNLQSLFSGRFTSEFETYTTDQFAFRDSWTTLKARSELAVGKEENNSVYYCGEDAPGTGVTLIKGFSASDQDDLDVKLAALNTLSETTDAALTFALIPGASEVWKDKLPKNAPVDSEKSVIDYVYAHTGVKTVDMLGALSAHAEDPIYYRTDHHWTSLGAYYGYAALMDTMGLASEPLSHYRIRTVSDSFLGTVYSSSGFSWVSPDRIETFVDPPAGLTVTRDLGAAAKTVGLYDPAFLDKKDKYSYFLGGNTPLVRIETGNEDAPSLLIVRDSYADCLAPFLLENFSEIQLLDLRYFRTSLSAYIDEQSFDSILVCYSVENFCSDTNIPLLGK